MASYLQQVILIALILSIAIPISIGHLDNSKYDSDWEDEPDNDDRDDPDSKIGRYLRHLCSDTKRSKQCWKIIKPEINRFTNTDSRNVVGVVINLALEKSDEISDKLNQLHQDSVDDELKKKYLTCSRNYNDAHHNLDIAKGNLDSDDYRRIQHRIDVVNKELKSCKHQFGRKSYDPANIGTKNREFGRYVEIVEAATKRFVKERESNSARKH